MPNIEIKATCPDLSKARLTAEQLQTEYVGILNQVDTYFNTKDGRLKLREINNSEAQLIPYYKEYTKGPMKSMYSVLPSVDPKTLKHILDKTLGTLTIVDKKREVFLIENIRVHLDSVKDLGEFIEFEAVYSDPSEEENEFEKVKNLKKKFEISDEHLLDKSYIDYLLQRQCDSFLKTLYRFSNDDYILIEVKRLDLSSDTPKDKRNFWFLYTIKSKELKRLEFVSMSSNDKLQKREFKQASVEFDDQNANLKFDSQLNKLRKSEKIHTDFNISLLSFFSKSYLP